MKRFLIIAALTLATAGTASAMISPNQLSIGERHVVRTYVPDANLDSLTTWQVAAIQNIFISSDNHSGGANVAGAIKAILNRG